MSIVKNDLKITTNHVLILGAALAVIYTAKKGYEQAKELVKDTGEAINPASTNNIVYRSVNGVGAAVTGNQSFSLGSWLYDITHKEESEKLTQNTYKTEANYDNLNSESIA